MRYLGGKCRLAKGISEVILGSTISRRRYIEPFVGGGAVAVKMAPHFEQVRLSDTLHDLILMYQALQDGWVPPDEVSEDLHRQLRDQFPSALRGFVGLGCSYAGKFFGGYAKDSKGTRNYAAEAKRGLLRDMQQLQNAVFIISDYRHLNIGDGDVVYCDPPYANTSGYTVGDFDSDAFWSVARGWHKMGAAVFVSEYTAPDDWAPLHSCEHARCIKDTPRAASSVQVTEHLFIHRDYFAC